MAFAIVINEKGGQPRRQEFLKGEITIGRVQGNDIVLPKQNVSKRHSRIVLKSGKFVITDLKSTNGTYVNGRKITTPMVIKETDKVYIGDFVLSAELSDVQEGVSNSGITPPPPPNASLGGAPIPFNNMPSKTIANGVSPFHDGAAPAPAPGMAPPAPPTPPAPPAPPTPSAPVAPQFSPTPEAPQPPQTSPFGQAPIASAGQASSPPMSSGLTPPPKPPTPTPPSPFSAPSQPLAPSAPPSQPEPAAEPPASSPFTAPVAPQAPQAPAVPEAPPAPAAPQAPAIATPAAAPIAEVQQSAAPILGAPTFGRVAPSDLASVRAPSASPSMVDLDSAVFDGAPDSALLVRAHTAISAGLAQRGLSTPSRYRPGQSVNPELISAAQELFDQLDEGSSDQLTQLMSELFGVGALQGLIENTAVSEIYLNGAHQLTYRERGGQLQSVSSPFSSAEQATRAAMRIINGLGAGDVQQAEGKLGSMRAFVDLQGAEGPYVCLQRACNAGGLSELMSAGALDQQTADSISRVISRGGKVVVASAQTRAQSQLTSAIAHDLFAASRVAILGASESLGDHPYWLTLPGEDTSLNGVTRLNAEGLIVADQPALSGSLVFEALSAASTGVLMITARDINSAVEKLRRRAGDDRLVAESVDAVVFVQAQASELRVTDVYDISRGEVVMSQGAWRGQLS